MYVNDKKVDDGDDVDTTAATEMHISYFPFSAFHKVF